MLPFPGQSRVVTRGTPPLIGRGTRIEKGYTFYVPIQFGFLGAVVVERLRSAYRGVGVNMLLSSFVIASPFDCDYKVAYRLGVAAICWGRRFTEGHA
jgi:hypothetical protein